MKDPARRAISHIKRTVLIENTLFLVLFFILICLPALHINRAENSETENRRLAVFPKLTEQEGINRRFGQEFDAWFNDRFFLRQQLVARYTKLIGSANHHVQNDHVLVGQEGWAFLKDDNGIENFKNRSAFSEEDMRLFADYLKQADEWCRHHNCHFYFLIPPDKEKIYAEFYPSWVKKSKPDTQSRTYQLIDYLRKNTEVSVIYPREEMLAEKESGDLLYLKNDTHWTERGAYVAYQALHREIFEACRPEYLQIPSWKTYHRAKGDMNTLFPDLPKDSVSAYLTPAIATSYTFQESGNKPYTDKYYTNPQGEYRALFMRDSFSDVLIDFYFGNSFQHITSHWRYILLPEDLQYIEEYQIDVVVVETVERLLPKLLNGLKNNQKKDLEVL